MNALLLKFWRILEPATHAHKSLQIYGPLFHRWLPDGKNDAIELVTYDSNAKLKVWFERLGYVEPGGFIRFDYQRAEVDSQVLSRQALLQGGPLCGSLEITGLSQDVIDVIEVVKENRRGHQLYMALGKRVAKNLLQPAISRFLDLLKTNYGQYWIPNLEPWDSRRESLGGYFAGGFGGLFVDWSIDGEKWKDFRPDDPSATSTSGLGRDFSDYLSKNDWQELRQAAESAYEPTLAALALARAHQLKDQGNIRQAFVEGVTALEIALSEFLRARFEQKKHLIDSAQAFYELPLRAQLLILSATNPKLSMTDVEDSIKAIDVRHKIVHEGKSPSPSDETKVSALFRTVAAFLLGPICRFPKLITSANMLFGPDEAGKKE